MKKKILETIKKHELLDREPTAVVFGLSGGPDSLALFDCMAELSSDYKRTKGRFGLNIELYPVHVNHKLRPGEAENDQKFVEDYTLSLSKLNPAVHPAESFVTDCNELSRNEGLTDEEAGRVARYRAFSEVADRLIDMGKAVAIAVAQNAEDQAETILFRIIRGTGIDGLSGIAYKRMHETSEGRRVPVIRPLLDTSRVEIEAYIKEKKLSPCRDLTNDETIYTRNRIRLNLIPELKKLNPNIIETVNRLGRIAKLENDFMELMTVAVVSVTVTTPPEDLMQHLPEELIKGAEADFSATKKKKTYPGKHLALDCWTLGNIEKAVRFRLYRRALETIGLTEDVTLKALEAIDKIRISENHKIPETEVHGGYTVIRFKGKLVFLAPAGGQ